MTRRPDIPALTGLRFVAAFGVMALHFATATNLPVLSALFSPGQAGVPLFFVLSGFVLAYNYEGRFTRGLAGTGDYLRARFARIFPMHAAALILIAPLALWLFGSSLGSWLANLSLIQVYFPSYAVQDGWNAPAWSIADETVFYLSLPLFVRFALSRVRTARGAAVLALGMWAGGVACLALVGPPMVAAFAKGDPTLSYFATVRLPIFRIWEFWMGAALAGVFSRTARRPSAAMSGLLVLLGVGGIAVVAGSGAGSSAVRNLMFAPFAVILIAGLASGPSPLTRLLARPVPVALGEASYSLYLLHWPAVLLLPFAPGPVGFALATAATIGASLAGYRWVESPARRWLRGLQPARRRLHDQVLIQRAGLVE